MPITIDYLTAEGLLVGEGVEVAGDAVQIVELGARKVEGSVPCGSGRGVGVLGKRIGRQRGSGFAVSAENRGGERVFCCISVLNRRAVRGGRQGEK
jgi:hypothetical protein